MTNPFADPAGADIVVPGTTPVHQFPLPPETRDYRPLFLHLRLDHQHHLLQVIRRLAQYHLTTEWIKLHFLQFFVCL
jgi:hypothetical protein